VKGTEFSSSFFALGKIATLSLLSVTQDVSSSPSRALFLNLKPTLLKNSHSFSGRFPHKELSNEVPGYFLRISIVLMNADAAFFDCPLYFATPPLCFFTSFLQLFFPPSFCCQLYAQYIRDSFLNQPSPLLFIRTQSINLHTLLISSFPFFPVHNTCYLLFLMAGPEPVGTVLWLLEQSPDPSSLWLPQPLVSLTPVLTSNFFPSLRSLFQHHFFMDLQFPRCKFRHLSSPVYQPGSVVQHLPDCP